MTTDAARPRPAHRAPPRHAWQRDLAHRFAYRFWAKTLGICAFMWVFFALYFWLLRNPQSAVTVMPLTALDTVVPYQPGWVWVYLSLWVYVGVPPGLMLRPVEVLRYGAWSALLCGAGLAAFACWPSAVPPREGLEDLADNAGMALLRGVDAAGNACPSLHVASAVFTALWSCRVFRHVGAPAWLHGLSFVWAAGIVYSTLAIRQHVVWDAVAGTALALAVGALSLRWGGALSASPTALRR